MLSLLRPLLLHLIDRCLDRRESPGPFLQFCIDHDSELARYLQDNIRLEEQLMRDLPTFLQQDTETLSASLGMVMKKKSQPVYRWGHGLAWGAVAALLLVVCGGFFLFDRFETQRVALSRPELISEQQTTSVTSGEIPSVPSVVSSSAPSELKDRDEMYPWWLLMPEVDSVLKSATNWGNLPLVSQMSRSATVEPDLFQMDSQSSSSENVTTNNSQNQGTSLLRELANSNPVTSYVADIYFPSTTAKN